MADIIDDAQDLIEKQMEISRRAISLSTVHVLPVGSCLYCDTVLDPPKLYCDSSCADEHAYAEKRARQNARTM